jgi:hypothetical protein
MKVVCPVIGLETIVNCPQHSMALKDVLKHPCIDEGWNLTDGVTINPSIQGFFFSADISEISPETENLAPLREMLISFKKIRLDLNFKSKIRYKRLPCFEL